MAGDWFPLQYWRSRSPEIVRVSSMTGRSRHEILGWVCDFWSWVSTESEDGRVRGVFIKNLPDLIGADAALWEALRSVGWIAEDAGPGAGIVVPGWEIWLCESGKKRLKDAQRKRSDRNEGRDNSGKPTRKKRPRNVRETSTENTPTEQNRTEESKEEDPPNPPQAGGAVNPAPDSVAPVPIPAPLDTPDFRAAWDGWKAERRAKKHKPYTPRGEAQQLARLAPFGPAVALAAIRESIAQGWQGLFPEKHAQQNRAPPRGNGRENYVLGMIRDALED